ncbi:MAG: tRNA (N6-threonylcarbamoyladenosine(37)-N6)-methyltransferase TrmO [Deltaproteobacteria bacterium]|nr:tRNA (N6-threonylcarbamoyladenosine(37)-N6)-methyltransferase TrmO [Deltaproteobacteria bacterium]
MEPVGIVRSCWPDRWGIPRQPGLAPSAWAELHLAPHVPTEALRGIEGYSHLWLTIQFHAVTHTRWTGRPPRLEGDRVGVFASRSPHRPSGIGLSLVRLASVDLGARVLHLRDHDLLDGTPVLDIKPYVSWCDAPVDARSGFAPAPPTPRPVFFDPGAWPLLDGREATARIIAETLAADPRQGRPGWKQMRVRVEDLDVHVRVDGEALVVENVVVWQGPR